MAVSIWLCQHGCVNMAVSTWLCQHGCVNMAVSTWPCQHGCVNMAVSTWLCHHGCVIMAVSTWLCQHGCVNMAVSTCLCQNGCVNMALLTWQCQHSGSYLFTLAFNGLIPFSFAHCRATLTVIRLLNKAIFTSSIKPNRSLSFNSCSSTDLFLSNSAHHCHSSIIIYFFLPFTISFISISHSTLLCPYTTPLIQFLPHIVTSSHFDSVRSVSTHTSVLFSPYTPHSFPVPHPFQFLIPCQLRL